VTPAWRPRVARLARLAVLAVLADLALGGVASAAPSFQARCEALTAASGAAFSSRDNGYRIDNSLSYRSLTQMKRPNVANGYVLGLTRTESRVSIKIDGQLLREPQSGIECVAPRIEVALYYQPIVIYVGREFAPDTCAYREILAHEMRHLKSYMDYLPKVEERARIKLGQRFVGKPLYTRSGWARDVLQSDIDRGWMPFIKGEMAAVERLQAAIDSPREYARLSKVCQGEVQSLIGSTRRAAS
jgi:hypothetical protein